MLLLLPCKATYTLYGTQSDHVVFRDWIMLSMLITKTVAPCVHTRAGGRYKYHERGWSLHCLSLSCPISSLQYLLTLFTLISNHIRRVVRTNMPSQWADQPYSLISTEPFSKDVQYSSHCQKLSINS